MLIKLLPFQSSIVRLFEGTILAVLKKILDVFMEDSLANSVLYIVGNIVRLYTFKNAMFILFQNKNVIQNGYFC
jgi:hypothetical protein